MMSLDYDPRRPAPAARTSSPRALLSAALGAAALLMAGPAQAQLSTLEVYGDAVDDGQINEVNGLSLGFTQDGPDDYTITSAGSDHWGTSDNGSWLHDGIPTIGDFTAIVRQVSIDPRRNEWGRTGPMARASTAANSANAAMVRKTVNNNNRGVALQWRDATGGNTNRNGDGPTQALQSSNNGTTTPLTKPIWLALSRSNGQWLGSWAQDVNGQPGPWSRTDTHPVSADLAGDLLVGLAHQSHGGGGAAPNTAVFEDFSVTAFNPAAHPQYGVTTAVLDVDFNNEGKVVGRAFIDNDGEAIPIDWTIEVSRVPLEHPGDPGVLVEHYQGSGNLGSIEALRAYFAANAPTVGPFVAAQLAWGGSSNFGDDQGIPRYYPEVEAAHPGGREGNGSLRDYSARVTAELLIPESGTYRFKDGVDDFTYFAVGGVALINDNTWTGMEGNQNGGSPIASITFEDVRPGGQWVPIEFVMGEGGGGDAGVIYWDHNNATFPAANNQAVGKPLPLIPAANLRLPLSSFTEAVTALSGSSVVGSAGGTGVFVDGEGNCITLPPVPDGWAYRFRASSDNLVTGSTVVEGSLSAARDDHFVTDETTPVRGSLLLNDEAIRVIASDTSGVKGQIVVNADGTFAYDPAGAFDGLVPGETAEETFRYWVNPHPIVSNRGEVTITVHGVNSPPVAGSDEGVAAVGEDDEGAVAIDNAVLLANDFDPEGEGILVVGVEAEASAGTVTAVRVTGKICALIYEIAVQDGAAGNREALLDLAADGSIRLERDFTPTYMTEVERVDFGGGTVGAPGDGNTLDRVGAGGNMFGGVGVPARADDVAAVFTGFITVPETATYRFTTRSDDGSVLDLDSDGDGFFAGNRVVSNNSFQGMTNRSGDVALTAGTYAIRMGWYEGGGGAGMQASWEQLDGANPFGRQIIPPWVLSSCTGEMVISYSPDGQFEHLAQGEVGEDIIRYVVEDASGGRSVGTATVWVTGENDRPSIDPAGNPRLKPVPVDVDPADNPGTRVSAIVASAGDAISDPDTADRLGIAVTGTNTHGVWQYRLAGTTEWVDFGDIGRIELGQGGAGGAGLGGGTVDGWTSNMLVNESQTYTNQSGAPQLISAEDFNFWVGRVQNRLTPFLAEVNGDNDFTVRAVGSTRIAGVDYVATGLHSVAFADGGSLFTLDPGATIATGFLDANADGSESGGGGGVIPFANAGDTDQLWYTGGGGAGDAGAVATGEAPTPGTNVLTNLVRDYQYSIGLALTPDPALLLGPNDWVRFQPAPGYISVPGAEPSITFRAWDGSGGTAGEIISVTEPGVFWSDFESVRDPADELKIDFNSTNQGGGPNNQDGFMAYDAGHEVAADFVGMDYAAFGTLVTLTPSWPDTTDNRVQQMIDRGNNFDANYAGDRVDLMTDWIGIDTRTGNGGNGDAAVTSMAFTLSGLPPGWYSYTSYHHDTEFVNAPFNVALADADGSRQVGSFHMTASTPGGNVNDNQANPGGGRGPVTLSSTAHFPIRSDGGDVVVTYSLQGQGNVHNQLFGVNGFELVRASVDLDDGTQVASTDGSATVSGGVLRLSQDKVGNTRSSYRVPPVPGSSRGWTAKFDATLIDSPDGQAAADGFSFNYAPIPPFSESGGGVTSVHQHGLGEEGFGVGLSVEFDTWDNGGAGENGFNVAVDGVDVAGGFVNAPVLPEGAVVNATACVSWDPVNGLSLSIDAGAGELVIFENLPTPGFAGGDDYRFAFAARTGGATETVLIDNLSIAAVDDSNLFSFSEGSDEATVQVSGEVSDLSIRQFVSVPSIEAGTSRQNLFVAVAVTNRGPRPATGVQVGLDLTLPPGVRVAYTTPGGVGQRWFVGDLGVGQTRILNIQLLVGASAAAGQDVIVSDASIALATSALFRTGDDSSRVTASIRGAPVPNDPGNAQSAFGQAVANAFPDDVGNPGTRATVWGPNADPDGDGFRNFIEFALGSDPNNAASVPETPVGVVDGGGPMFLQLTFDRLLESAGFTYVVEISQDMETWVGGFDFVRQVPVGGGGVIFGDNGPPEGYERVAFQPVDAIPADNMQYIRVRVRLLRNRDR